MTNEAVILDPNGKEVKVGSKVRYIDAEDPTTEPAEVIEITDWDGDVDDDTGQPITLVPRVRVRYPDGEVELWRTSGWKFEWVTGSDPELPEQQPSEGLIEELVVVDG
jgi:hypothetical protein